MASAFLVSLPLKCGMTLKGDNDSVIVWAEDAAMAKSLASAAMAGDVPAAAWSDATATALVTGTELEGWVFTINLTDNNDPTSVISVSYTGANSSTVDTAGAALVTALNATAINGAAYNSTSNVLTIVETTDGMGDWLIECIAKPPGSAYSTSLLGFGETDRGVSGIFTSLDAVGASGAARTVTLVAALPALYALCKVDRG
jgi:hypothetical protein